MKKYLRTLIREEILNFFEDTENKGYRKPLKEIYIFQHPNPETLNYKLEKIIRETGDQIGRKSNLLCDMTHPDMHHISPVFENFSEWVNGMVRDLTQEDEVYTQNIWGAIYRKGEFARTHNHIFEGPAKNHAIASFCYMVNVSEACSPLVFPNTKKLLESPQVIAPRNGTLAVWDPQLDHHVPPQYEGHERVIISGNIVDKNFPNLIPSYSRIKR